MPCIKFCYVRSTFVSEVPYLLRCDSAMIWGEKFKSLHISIYECCSFLYRFRTCPSGARGT